MSASGRRLPLLGVSESFGDNGLPSIEPVPQGMILLGDHSLEPLDKEVLLLGRRKLLGHGQN